MSDLRLQHLNCAHIQRMKLGGLPLACHVLLGLFIAYMGCKNSHWE